VESDDQLKHLTRNAVQCLNCLDIIESTSVHHFRACACGSVHVDGGLEYLRRGWQGMNPEFCYKELSTYE
jgi:hypothetical protein